MGFEDPAFRGDKTTNPQETIPQKMLLQREKELQFHDLNKQADREKTNRNARWEREDPNDRDYMTPI